MSDGYIPKSLVKEYPIANPPRDPLPEYYADEILLGHCMLKPEEHPRLSKKIVRFPRDNLRLDMWPVYANGVYIGTGIAIRLLLLKGLVKTSTEKMVEQTLQPEERVQGQAGEDVEL